MRLLRLSLDGTPLFENSRIGLDFYATDRVVQATCPEGILDVTRAGRTGSIFSQNIIGISGVNASGKTTLLNLLGFVLGYLSGPYSMRSIRMGRIGSLGKLDGLLHVDVVFWHEDSFFLLESTLRHYFEPLGNDAGGKLLGDQFYFEDETLWELQATRINREMIANKETFVSSSVVKMKRTGKPGTAGALSEEERTFLSPDTSIVSALVRPSPTAVETPSRMLADLSLPSEVVQAFDGSIEYLRWEPDAQVYRLKFKHENELVLSRDATTAMLSSGTVLGTDLVTHAIGALRDGGYFIVDEIESSLNRSLVGAVIGLFASPVTNPRGAMLVFTTHYPELLDVLRRKDNVYLLVRNEGQHTRIIKYSDKVKRIENKKSEVVLSDFIAGTTPRYPDVQAMREYVRTHVNG